MLNLNILIYPFLNKIFLKSIYFEILYITYYTFLGCLNIKLQDVLLLFDIIINFVFAYRNNM